MPLILLLYELMKIINRRVALLALFFSLGGSAVQCASLLGHLAPLILLGICYLTNSFALFIAPGVAPTVFAILMVSGLAEVIFCLRLLIRGVNRERWLEQADQDRL